MQPAVILVPVPVIVPLPKAGTGWLKKVRPVQTPRPRPTWPLRQPIPTQAIRERLAQTRRQLAERHQSAR
jgi:hypothetical protein